MFFHIIWQKITIYTTYIYKYIFHFYDIIVIKERKRTKYTKTKMKIHYKSNNCNHHLPHINIYKKKKHKIKINLYNNIVQQSLILNIYQQNIKNRLSWLFFVVIYMLSKNYRFFYLFLRKYWLVWCIFFFFLSEYNWNHKILVT